MQELGELAMVGQFPFPAPSAQLALSEPGAEFWGARLDGGEECGNTLAVEQPGPALQHGRPGGEPVVVRAGELGEIRADEVGEDGGAHGGPAGLVESAEQGEPVARCSRREHRIRSGEGHRYSRTGELGCDLAAAVVRAHQDGDVTRRQWARARGGRELQPGVEQPRHLGHQIGVDASAGVALGHRSRRLDPAQADGGACDPVAQQSRRGVVRGDRLHVDARAECRRPEQAGDAGDDAGVRTVVHGKGELLARGPDGVQVGGHVSATEAVDRLFGVADQHQRHVPGEGVPQDRPLHGVRVLELVHQHDLAAPPQPLGSDRAGRDERIAKPHELVVVGVDAEASLPVGELPAHMGGEADPLGRDADRFARDQAEVREPDRVKAEAVSGGQVERRLSRVGVASQVQIFDDLLAQ